MNINKKKSYTYSLKVTKNEIDKLNHVNNIHYVQWVQNAAQKHWESLCDTNFGFKYVWVVLRHEVDYLSSAKLNDELTVHTWIGASFGVKSERFVEIKKGSILIAKAKTIWCLLEKETMKPVRIPLEVMKILKFESEESYI